MATPNPLPDMDEKLHPPLKEEPPTTENRPFVLPGRTGGSGGKDKTSRMIMIAVGALVLLIGFFGLISTKGTKRHKREASDAGKPNLGRVVTPSPPGQLVPADKMTVQSAEAKSEALDAHDIEKTKNAAIPKGPASAANATLKPKSVPTAGNKSLGDIAQFQQPDTDPDHLKNWNPEPYSGKAEANGQQGSSGQQTQAARLEDEQYARPSMIFVAHNASGADRSGIKLSPEIDNFGLESGYHVAARLESMASTALHTPVTAVIEYNYERDGRILIPAGARAIGKITQADARGTMNIEFSSVELPGGESLPISAIGATTLLQTIKGQVTGKNAGRSLAVRSLAGLGEAGAMLVGQGNINGAVSESDLIRQRAAENLGNGADAQVMNMMVTQHIVVSVPAGTEIYLIFTRPQKVSPNTAQTISVAGSAPQ